MAGKSILIVDDSALITERLQGMLEALENIRSIECAGDYHKATQLLMTAARDIALLDINLPGKSGIELLRHIKANYPQTHVVMLSNQSGDYYRAVCKRLGAAYFMDKSEQFDEVMSVVSSLL